MLIFFPCLFMISIANLGIKRICANKINLPFAFITLQRLVLQTKRDQFKKKNLQAFYYDDYASQHCKK